MSVERAKFEMKGSAYDPSKKPKKVGKKEVEKVQKRKVDSCYSLMAICICYLSMDLPVPKLQCHKNLPFPLA